MATHHDIELGLSDGAGTLAATVVSPSRPSGAAVLFVHGLGSDRSTNIDRANALADTHGTTCLALDLRGHGASSGSLSQVTPRENLADVVTGFDALLDRDGVTSSRAGVCAASYGAYLSVLLSGERAVARLLLRAPALYADSCVDSTLSQRRVGSMLESPRFVRLLGALAMPVLLVESEHDEVIAPAVVGTYLAGQPAIERVVLPGAGHALTEPAWRADYQRLLVGFFADL